MAEIKSPWPWEDPQEVREFCCPPEQIVLYNREQVAQHAEGCTCHPMKLNRYGEDGDPDACCSRDPTALLIPALIDALDSMNFVWHLDSRCRWEADAVKHVQERAVVRYINDGQWHAMFRWLRSALCLLVAAPIVLAAEDKPWPQNGDRIFLPVDLMYRVIPRSTVPMGLDRLTCDNTAFCRYSIPACESLLLVGLHKDETRAEIRDIHGAPVFLDGAWRLAIFRARDTCERAAAVAGLFGEKGVPGKGYIVATQDAKTWNLVISVTPFPDPK